MFDHRLRPPSPALVISMMAALSLALGGTAVAAGTAGHPDARADKALIVKMEPTLKVNYAKTAGSAATAAYATNATNATNATQLGARPASYYAPAGHPAVRSEARASQRSETAQKNYGGAWSRAGFWKGARSRPSARHPHRQEGGQGCLPAPRRLPPSSGHLHGGCRREPLDQHRDPRQRRNLDHRIRRGRPRRLDLPGRAGHNHSKTKLEPKQPSHVPGRPGENEVSTR